MTKEMLLMMLMQQAPALLQGITQREGFSPEINVPKGFFGSDYPDTAYVFPGGQISNIVDGEFTFADDPELGFDPAVVNLLNQYDNEKIPMPQNDVVPGTDIPWDDRDMDELHSTEMWDSGANYQKKDKLKDWYKKNRR